MKKVYYSEELKKNFNSPEECLAAEKEFEAKMQKEKEKKDESISEEEAKALAKVEEAYQAVIAVEKEKRAILAKQAKIDQEYCKIFEEYISKFGIPVPGHGDHEGDRLTKQDLKDFIDILSSAFNH